MARGSGSFQTIIDSAAVLSTLCEIWRNIGEAEEIKIIVMANVAVAANIK